MLASEIHASVELTDSCDFDVLSTALPPLDEYGAEYFHVADLDREVFAMAGRQSRTRILFTEHGSCQKGSSSIGTPRV